MNKKKAIPIYATGGIVGDDGKKPKATTKSQYTPTVKKSLIGDSYYTDATFEKGLKTHLKDAIGNRGQYTSGYNNAALTRGQDKKGKYTAAYDPNFFDNNKLKSMFGSKDELYTRVYDKDIKVDKSYYPITKKAGTKFDKISEAVDVASSKKDKIKLSGNNLNLTQGRHRGGKMDKAIVDEVLKASKKKGTNPNDLLAIMSRESTLGATSSKNNDDMAVLVSGWNVNEDSYPYDFNRFLADKKTPGVVREKIIGLNSYYIRDSAAVEKTLKANPQYLQEYDKKLNSRKPLQNSFEGSIDFLKKKGIKGYNAGDPDYPNKVAKDRKLVEAEPELQKYIKQNINKYAMGGQIQMGSRQKRIAPLVVGAISGAISLISGISGASKAKKAKEDARLASLKQEQDALRASMSQQAQADAQALANFDEAGQEGVQYYKKGGEIAPKTAQNQVAGQMGLANPYNAQGGGLKPNLPISNGGYQTKGGNLIPIGDGVELAVGNRHNEDTIDGVSGIQLSQEGEPVAEIENKEVLADGHTVYSDRLKFKGNKSYADAMVALTKKRNKLESKQTATNNTAEKNTLDRQLAGLNMAEETLFKIQEVHKEMEGKHVLNNIFAYGGKSPGRPLPVPKWMQTFANTMKTGKYKGYATNALNDYRDPNNPDVVISENGMPKYPYDETIKPFKPKMLATPIDQSAGMSNGSGELMKGITGAATSVVGSIGTDSNKTNVAPTTITTPASVTAGTTTSTTSVQNKTGTDWAKIAGMVGNFAPKIIDNIVNSAQTRNAPQLPNLLHSVATPLETRVNINPALSEARQRTATLRKSVLDNTSNSNNAKSNMVATSLATGKQINELLAGKENQEMSLRNANAQNQQAVANANIAQDNERSMMEFQRANDLNTMRSANWANLAGDITSTINEIKLDNQFNADTQANIMDDPMGSKALLFAQNKEFMNSKSNRDFIFKLAQTKKNPVLVKYLQDNYNYTN